MKDLFMAAALVAATAAAGPEGIVTPLFNGEDLSGWWGCGTENPAEWMALPAEELAAKKNASLANIEQHWRVERGVLINDGHGLFLTTDKNYADFELSLEYQTVPRADSGVYLRGIPQVQIWDPTEKAKAELGADKGSGGLWNNPAGAPGKDPLVRADKPFGEWNELRVQMVGEYVTVHLNGQRVVDHARMDNYFNRALPLPRSGPIQLQTHGGEIRWRNIYLREMGPAEANRVLAGYAFDAAYVPIKKWMGAVDHYAFAEGEVRCKPHKGGVLFSQATYSDFAARFEFKLPPGGNNGLAIRYPGHGDPAYSGMCELQVLDNEAPPFAALDARQYHGSAYGMVPARRGYLRPVGEWNFQTVEVVGPTIRVELNGFQILDADLSTVTDFMHNKPHPGKDRAAGHFGFAGHHDPVVFRQIMIKELSHE